MAWYELEPRKRSRSSSPVRTQDFHSCNRGSNPLRDARSLKFRFVAMEGQITLQHSKFWLIRGAEGVNFKEILGLADGDLEIQENGIWKVINGGNYAEGEENSAAVNMLKALKDGRKDNLYSKWDEALDLYISNQGVSVTSGDIPVTRVPRKYAQAHANAELATTTTLSVEMMKNGISNRLTDVKGNGNDPFIIAFGGHNHQNEISGFGCSGNLYGLCGGADYVFSLNNEQYFRVGSMLGYVRGESEFFGSAAGKQKDAKQDMYSISLFGAYEKFGKKGLKTNINLLAGLGYSENKLFRIDESNMPFRGKFDSTNQFIDLEIIKNIYTLKGYQIGPWIGLSYNHINQKGYNESSLADAIGAQSISKVKHDFLDTIVGINIEKEFESQFDKEKRFRIYLRAGWKCQSVRKHSATTVSIPSVGLGNFSPKFGYSAKNSAVIIAGFRNKINAHWDFVGTWSGNYNKDYSSNVVSLSAGYNF